jgi:hypothetical protein
MVKGGADGVMKFKNELGILGKVWWKVDSGEDVERRSGGNAEQSRRPRYRRGLDGSWMVRLAWSSVMASS